MPVIDVVTNVKAPIEAKHKLLASLTDLVASELKIPRGHVHVCISDEKSFSFGGDFTTPAAWITFKSSKLQIQPMVRKNLVVKMVPLLEEAIPGLIADRTTTLFQELPVENIAVGTNIMVFRGSMDSVR